MAPRLQNIEKTGCRIFFWFHAISTDDVLFTPFPARALRRALCVHCQNTRTRPAPPSCSEPWCCAVLAAAVCLLVSLCARSWNTIVSLKGPCSISRYLQIFWEYCWWKKSCTAAGMFDNTVWLLPPHPLFNVVFSSLARRCRISVIQLLCFCDNFFLPMLNGEHEGQDSKCVWWCRIFSINRMEQCLQMLGSYLERKKRYDNRGYRSAVRRQLKRLLQENNIAFPDWLDDHTAPVMDWRDKAFKEIQSLKKTGKMTTGEGPGLKAPRHVPPSSGGASGLPAEGTQMEAVQVAAAAWTSACIIGHSSWHT